LNIVDVPAVMFHYLFLVGIRAWLRELFLEKAMPVYRCVLCA
jgi:hypothetical protein